MSNANPRTDQLSKLRPSSEMGKLSSRCISTRIPEKYMPLLDEMGGERSRWLRGVIVDALEELAAKE